MFKHIQSGGDDRFRQNLCSCVLGRRLPAQQWLVASARLRSEKYGAKDIS